MGVARGGRWGVGKMGEGGQKIQSYKLHKTGNVMYMVTI